MSEDAASRGEGFHLEHMGSSGFNESPSITVHGEGEALASLFKKLSMVNASIPKLKHTGKYSAGKTNYTFATEADVIEPIAAALTQAGLATIPSVVAQYWHDMPGKYGTNRLCTVHAQMIIGDTDTGAYVLAHTFSTAANGDKASNAAFTTAIKYLLAKLALVAFGDDADEYTVDGDKAVGAGPAPKSKPKVLTVKKRDELMARVVEAGKQDSVKAWLKENSVAWSKITEKQAAEVGAMLDD